jgi:hypothetical protein
VWLCGGCGGFLSACHRGCAQAWDTVCASDRCSRTVRVAVKLVVLEQPVRDNQWVRNAAAGSAVVAPHEISVRVAITGSLDSSRFCTTEHRTGHKMRYDHRFSLSIKF